MKRKLLVILAIWGLLLVAWALLAHAGPMTRCWLYDGAGKLISVTAENVVPKAGQFVVILDAERKPTVERIAAGKAAVQAKLSRPDKVKADTRLLEIEARLKTLEAASFLPGR